MARRITLKIDVDLMRGSKEAHAVTIAKIAEAVGSFAVEQIEGRGYSIQQAKATTELHYVRHVMTKVLKAAPKVRRLKKVS